MKTTALNPNHFRKAQKKHSHQTCYLAEPKQIVRTESTNTCTAGTDTNHSIVFTLLVELNVILDTIRVTKLSQQSFCHSWQNTLPFSKSVKSDHN